MRKYDTLKEKMPELQLNIPLRCKIYTAKPKRQIFSPHWHDRLEILLVKEGALIIEIDGETFTVLPGQAGVISPCQVHSGSTNESGAVYLMLMLDLKLLRNNTPAVKNTIDMLISEKLSYKKVIDDPVLRNYAALIEEEYKNGPSPITVQGYIYLLLGIFDKNYSIFPQRVKATSTDKISAVTDYINENFKKPLTTKQLSDRFGYTEAYFCRRFKQETSFTPMQYLKITRIENAKRLLALGVRVSDASTQSGFSDNVYFAKCFKKQVGMTPSEYATKKHDNARLEITIH